MTGYIGIGGTARKVKNLYFGVGGTARKVKKAYIGVNGVAQLWYRSQREWVWDKYTVDTGYNEVQGTSIAVNRTSAFYAGTSYTLSQSTGEFTVAQTTQIARSRTGATNAVGKYYITITSSSGTRTGSTVYRITAASYSSLTLHLTVTPITSQYYENRGSLVGSVTDLDVTAYPINGVQNGYWYVLKDIGTVSYSGHYTEQCVYMANKACRLLTITGSGMLTLGASSKADIWLCGGGASGDSGLENNTGAGGAGAYAQSAANVTIQNLTIQIGAGGVGFVDSGTGRLNSWTPSAGGNSSISGDVTLSAAGAGAGNIPTSIRSGGTGAGGGRRRTAGGTGDGLSKLPFNDNFFPYPYCDGGGGGAYRNSGTVYWGGDGGTNGSNGNDSITPPSSANFGEHIGQGGGQYGGDGGGYGWDSTDHSPNGDNATGYGSGGGGGGYAVNADYDTSGGGGSGYQGVCFIRIPLE